jgi:alpha-tubulin suppressor-like RCC1 family protein
MSGSVRPGLTHQAGRPRAMSDRSILRRVPARLAAAATIVAFLGALLPAPIATAVLSPAFDTTAPTAATAVPSSALQVAAGSSYTCALTTGDGVKCWGLNNDGQLGNGSTISQSLVPVSVSGLRSGVTAIAAGGDHTCALTTGGGVKCWGGNSTGELGNGSTSNSRTPVDVVGLSSGVTAITAGFYHTCALSIGGGVKCWGQGLSRQLGNGSLSNSATPVDVVGLTSGVTAIAAGLSLTCAVMSGGSVKCWGADGWGALGNGSGTSVNVTPIDVAGLGSAVSAITAGSNHTCALTTGGGVKCWGANYEAQLGNGLISNHSDTPVDVVGFSSGVTAITAGGYHTCALSIGGDVKCWGHNWFGDLGDGSETDRSSPVDVIGLTSGVSAIAAGFTHTCALMSGGGVKCWGENANGELGNGSKANSSAPVDVFFSAGQTAGATTAWQAKVGPSGVNGTANVSTITTGVGSIGLKLVKLRASSILPVVLYKGTCASVGAVLFRLASITTSSTGAASRTNTLTAAQVKLILAATTGTGKIAIRVGSGASAKCGAFTKRSVLGPQAVVQAFYNWWLTNHDWSRLLARPDITPGFVRWLKSFAAGSPMVGGHDPILCAQNDPDSVKAGPAAISGLTATVAATQVWNGIVGPPGSGPKVSLVLAPAGWRISAVDCGI